MKRKASSAKVMGNKRHCRSPAADRLYRGRGKCSQATPRQTRSGAAAADAAPLVCLDDKGGEIVVVPVRRRPAPLAKHAVKAVVENVAENVVKDVAEDVVEVVVEVVTRNVAMDVVKDVAKAVVENVADDVAKNVAKKVIKPAKPVQPAKPVKQRAARDRKLRWDASGYSPSYPPQDGWCYVAET